MAYYQDIPLPPRAEPSAFHPEGKAPVPERFRLELALDPDHKQLILSAFLNETPAFYRGRGYFTERPSDLPGAGFRVAVVGLLDPFLNKSGCIEARHFPIVLRVVVPKLRRDGVLLNCELRLAEELPIVFHLNWEENAQAAVLCVEDMVERDSLLPCPALESYRLSGHTLYRLNSAQMQGLEAYPAGKKLLSAAEWQELCRFQERFPQFFKTSELLEVKRRLAEQEQMKREAAEEGSPSVLFERTVPKPPKLSEMPEMPRPPKRPMLTTEALRPTVSRRSEIISLPAPLLDSAELTCSVGNQIYASRTALFLHDAQRLKNYTVTKAQFVPFRTGRPTYSDMNLRQRSWYFFWRAEFNKGILQKTDIAYLYVAIYELLNQVTASGAEALSRLLRLWEGYRTAFPYLDICMPAWCVDFMLLNHLGTDFDSIHERIPFRLTDCGVPAELFLNRRLQSGLSALPLSLLSRFSEYDICASRFCKTDANRKNMEKLVRKALETAEQASLAQGTPFLESFHVRKRDFFHESYYGAIVERTNAQRIVLKYVPLIGNHDFQTTLSGILRACENALRRRERFPGRLKEEKLPAYLTDTLTPLLEKVSQRPVEQKKTKISVSVAEKHPPQKPLVIDLSHARDLEEQSWENTRRLLEALGENAAETDDTQEETGTTEIAASAEVCVQPEQKEISVETQEETPEIGIFAALSEPAAAVLRALLTENAAEVRRICTENMTFPEAVYEEINEAALETIGDLLLDTTTGEIFEDYRDTITTELEMGR